MNVGDDGPGEYRFVKHPAPKQKPKKTDIFVSRKSRRTHLVKRINKMLFKGQTCVVHGLGAAIQPAIELCLELNRRWDGKLKLECLTDTVALMDELQPLQTGLEAKVETRFNSSIQITIKRS
jgi:hypothetical protein